jgi:hypothetical protein
MRRDIAARVVARKTDSAPALQLVVEISWQFAQFGV